MKNLIATSNHVLKAFPTDKAIMILKKLGYDAVEIWQQNLDYQIKNKITSLEKIKKALNKTKLEGVVHASTRNLLSKDCYRYNICSGNVKLRNESIKEQIRGIKLAKKFGFKLVNIHPGFCENSRKPWKILCISINKILKEAKKNNIKIAMECMEERPFEFVKSAKDVLKVIEKVGLKNFGTTFDITHAYTHGKTRPIEYLHKFKHTILHVHVSGYSKVKTHVPFEMSEMPKDYLKNFLQKLIKEYHGIISIEGALNVTKDRQLKIVQSNLKFVKACIRNL